MSINIVEIQNLINSICNIDDYDSVCDQLNNLGKLIKKDEDFVKDVYESLDIDSQNVFSELLNYYDGAIYLCLIKKDSKDDLDAFLKLLSLGWTTDSYDEFHEFRSREYRYPVICETTDLFTMIENESEDGGFNSLSDFILEDYGSLNDFCIDTIKDYYLDNINECISSLDL